MDTLNIMAIRRVKELSGEIFSLLGELCKWTSPPLDIHDKTKLQCKIEDKLREQDSWLSALIDSRKE